MFRSLQRRFRPQVERLETRVVPCNTPPTIKPIDDTVYAFSTITLASEVYLAEANDADGDVLTFSATGLPPNLAMDSYTARVHGFVDGSMFPPEEEIPEDQYREYAVQVRVFDGTDSAETTSFLQVQRGGSEASVSIIPPGGFNGTIPRNGARVTFGFEVTMTGTANSSRELRWSVVEPDGIWPNTDDELYHERSITIEFNNLGFGRVTGSFDLFANASFQVTGDDDTSGENPCDPIYVLIETPIGWDLGWSNSLSVQVAAQ